MAPLTYQDKQDKCWRHTKLRFGSEVSREKNHLSRRVYFPVQLETRRDLGRSSYFLVSLVVSGGHCGKYSQLVRWVVWEKTSLVSTTSSRHRKVLSWRYRYLFSQGPSKILPFIMSVWWQQEDFHLSIDLSLIPSCCLAMHLNWIRKSEEGSAPIGGWVLCAGTS